MILFSLVYGLEKRWWFLYVFILPLAVNKHTIMTIPHIQGPPDIHAAVLSPVVRCPMQSFLWAYYSFPRNTLPSQLTLTSTTLTHAHFLPGHSCLWTWEDISSRTVCDDFTSWADCAWSRCLPVCWGFPGLNIVILCSTSPSLHSPQKREVQTWLMFRVWVCFGLRCSVDQRAFHAGQCLWRSVLISYD